MGTRFSEFQRLRAAHAVSRDRFCVAIHEMEVDDPFSIILEYDGSFPQPWTRVEVLRNVASVSAPANVSLGDRPYVAVSDEGDVFFLGEERIKTEKIRGAGIYSADADGSGAINGICHLEGRIYAFGFGGQIYFRDGQNVWVRLPIDDGQAARRGCFAFIAGAQDFGTYAGGYLAAEFQLSPAELREEQLKAASTGDFAKFQDLAKQIERLKQEQGVVRVPVGFLLAGEIGAMNRVEIGSEENSVGNISGIFRQGLDRWHRRLDLVWRRQVWIPECRLPRRQGQESYCRSPSSATAWSSLPTTHCTGLMAICCRR